jgi:hypothetical protein
VKAFGASFSKNPFGRGIRAPGIPTRVTVDMFFDRAAIKAALSQIEYDGLSKASMRVKDYAKRSIKKRGMARPQLKVMKDNPGKSLGELAAMPGVPATVQRQLRQRISEIVSPKGSPPGTPPFTHVPYGHMLGFRRNLYNAYDLRTHTAVVGPSKKGAQFGLPHLHEFGAKIEKTAWELNYKYPLVGKKTLERIVRDSRGNSNRWQKQYQQARQVKRVFRWLPTGKRPVNSGKWKPTNMTRLFPYPKRPFMRPALQKAISNGDIAKAFRGRVVV